ncbi:methyltransferase [Legionella lansingensis]|uniref:Methyltransferase n=2 Tax=Legionella lansingensis TaxID=45067 RepID=A0A0W0VF90_9GAMM|nr:methyltransferase [Legionella lansingensis]SNV58738.1 methyltransferase [Legionella lansingensis]
MTKRSQEKELLDLGHEFYDKTEYKDCLKKLFLVNKYFGFFRSTQKLLKPAPKTATLIDVGCGSGLFLLHLSNYFPHMNMLGIDINPDAILEGQSELNRWRNRELAQKVAFATQELHEVLAIKNVDILLATLLCHHLSDEELVTFFQQAYQKTNWMVIINDLHRHRLAYWLFACFSPLLFRNRLITHDGLISIQRGFTRAELKTLLAKANIADYQIKWCWPFRWQIILKKN